MLERLAPMFVRHFLLDKCLRSYQTFENLSNISPTTNAEQTWMLTAPTLSGQQMLYKVLQLVSPALRSWRLLPTLFIYFLFLSISFRFILEMTSLRKDY